MGYYYSASSPTGRVPGFGGGPRSRSGCGCFTIILIIVGCVIASKIYEKVDPEGAKKAREERKIDLYAPDPSVTEAVLGTTSTEDTTTQEEDEAVEAQEHGTPAPPKQATPTNVQQQNQAATSSKKQAELEELDMVLSQYTDKFQNLATTFESICGPQDAGAKEARLKELAQNITELRKQINKLNKETTQHERAPIFTQYQNNINSCRARIKQYSGMLMQSKWISKSTINTCVEL